MSENLSIDGNTEGNVLENSIPLAPVVPPPEVVNTNLDVSASGSVLENSIPLAPVVPPPEVVVPNVVGETEKSLENFRKDPPEVQKEDDFKEQLLDKHRNYVNGKLGKYKRDPSLLCSMRESDAIKDIRRVISIKGMTDVLKIRYLEQAIFLLSSSVMKKASSYAKRLLVDMRKKPDPNTEGSIPSKNNWSSWTSEALLGLDIDSLRGIYRAVSGVTMGTRFSKKIVVSNLMELRLLKLSADGVGRR